MKMNCPRCENRRATKAEATRGRPHSQRASPCSSESLLQPSREFRQVKEQLEKTSWILRIAMLVNRSSANGLTL
jgi:hypothetical protein